jgi:hypothetical protein
MPLTDEERAALNSIDTPAHERRRLYARDLRVTAEAYATAADAPGLGASAKAFLSSEAGRLTRESGGQFDLADVEERGTLPVPITGPNGYALVVNRSQPGDDKVVFSFRLGGRQAIGILPEQARAMAEALVVAAAVVEGGSK